MRSLLMILAITAIGCTNPHRQQAQADAHEGVDALGGNAYITQGIHTNIEAATGDDRSELPPPQMTRDQIVNDAPAYAEQAEENKKKANSGWLWGALGAGLTTILGVLKFVPGAHQPIVGLIDRVFSNSKDREAKRKDEVVRDYGRQALSVLDTVMADDDVPDDLRPVLDAYRQHVTDKV